MVLCRVRDNRLRRERIKYYKPYISTYEFKGYDEGGEFVPIHHRLCPVLDRTTTVLLDRIVFLIGLIFVFGIH